MTSAFAFYRGEKLTMKEMSLKFDEVIWIKGHPVLWNFELRIAQNAKSHAIRELDRHPNRVSLEETKKLGR